MGGAGSSSLASITANAVEALAEIDGLGTRLWTELAEEVVSFPDYRGKGLQLVPFN